MCSSKSERAKGFQILLGKHPRFGHKSLPLPSASASHQGGGGKLATLPDAPAAARLCQVCGSLGGGASRQPVTPGGLQTYCKSPAAAGASGSVALVRRFPNGTPRRGDLGQKSTNLLAEFELFWWECHKI
jgi:hypothetical protein